MSGASLARPVVFVPILHAGLGLLEGMLRVMPEGHVGHIGLYHDEVALRPRKLLLPVAGRPDPTQSDAVLLDPMLATGRSATESSNCELRTRISRAE